MHDYAQKQIRKASHYLGRGNVAAAKDALGRALDGLDIDDGDDDEDEVDDRDDGADDEWENDDISDRFDD